MRRSVFILCIAAAFGVAAGVSADEPMSQLGKKVNRDRLKGMKSALADIENGVLRQKGLARHYPLWYGDYMSALKDELRVEYEAVNPKDYPDGLAELDGYNDVMRVEIESRFEKGVLTKLKKQAMSVWKEK